MSRLARDYRSCLRGLSVPVKKSARRLAAFSALASEEATWSVGTVVAVSPLGAPQRRSTPVPRHKTVAAGPSLGETGTKKRAAGSQNAQETAALGHEESCDDTADLSRRRRLRTW